MVSFTLYDSRTVASSLVFVLLFILFVARNFARIYNTILLWHVFITSALYTSVAISVHRNRFLRRITYVGVFYAQLLLSVYTVYNHTRNHFVNLCVCVLTQAFFCRRRFT